MIHVNFPESNTILHAAPGDEATVEPLHVLKADGMVTSMWELSPEDMVQLMQTRRIVVQVVGASQPPMRLLVLPPEGPRQ